MFLYAFVICVSIGSACFAVESPSSLSDANWLSMEFPSSSSGGISATVCDSSGNLYIGGSFKTKDVNPIPFGVAKWDGTTWTPFLSGADDSVSVSSIVYSSGTIYAAGYFEPKTGSAFGFAKWNVLTSTWIPLGTDYGSFNVITCDSSGNLYASGSFKTASDVSFSIGKWNGSTWIQLGTDYSSANALVCDSSKNLYAGGLLDGSNNSVAKWNGTNWSPLGTLSGILMTLAYDSLGNLYAGGMFSDVSNNAFGVAKWDSLKLKWNIVGGTGLEWIVKTLAFDSSGNLYAGGRFTTIADGVPANYIARWNGSTWSAIGSGTGGDIGEVNALSYSSSSSVKTLYVGGAFTTAGGKSSNHIAKLIPSATPSEPRAVTAERGDTRAIVKFTPPVSNGGFDITSYEVTSNPDGIKATGSASPIAVTRLTNGKSYTFTVKATNAIGPFSSASTASNSVMPATIPDAPTKVIATPGIGQASVAFTAPFNGGSTITGYTLTSDPEGILKTGLANPIMVTGLTNGVAYTFFVTATNSLGTSEPSDASASVIPAIPITTIGVITGTVKVDSVLTAGTVTPIGATIKYQWMRCGTAAATTGDSIGENQNTYTAVADDAGKFIKVKVTGIGNYNSSVTSTATAVVFKPATISKISPINRSDWKFGTTFIAGNVLPATATVTYQWWYCETLEGTYENLTDGVTGNAYSYPRVAKSQYIKVTATGTGIYSGSVTSAAVSVMAVSITNIGAISGTVKVDSVLTAGAVMPTGANVDYQWMRCDTAAAATGVNIGLNQNTYTIVEADIGKFIKVEATGTGGNYINSKTSTALGPVPTPITVLPTIGGTAKVGQILTATATPLVATVSYQWQSAASSGGPYSNIVGAIVKTYTLKATDVTKFIRVVATGTLSYSGTVESAETAAVAPISVGSIAAITGTAQTGSVLTAGAVTPTAATVTYQWMRCAAATDATGASIGENKNTYLVDAADAGKFIKVQVTGIGGYSGIKLSTATTAVVPAPLTAIGVITGTVSVGSKLTAGALTPAAASATAIYQWESFSGATGPWTSIGDSLGTYTIKGPDDVGKLIRVKATASGYTGEKTSLATKAVPTPIMVPTIGGTATVGQMLTATASPLSAAVSYQWQSADTSGGSYSKISGATLITYTLKASDADKYIKVETTGIGNFSGTMLSTATTAVSPIPVTGIGAITGIVKVGSVLTAGALTPPVATVKYQWTSCTTVGGEYKNIDGATLRTYTVGAAEIAKFIKVVVTGTGGYGGTKTSEATTAVPKVPVTAIGAISGTAKVGSVLTAGAVTPAGATVDYQWMRCVTATAPIGASIGENQNTYTALADDVGKFIKVKVTGNGSYSDSATSTATAAVFTPIPIMTISPIWRRAGPRNFGTEFVAGTVSPAGATVTYQWLYSINGTTFYPYEKETSSTYLFPPTINPGYLKVKVTGIGLYSGSVTSAPVDKYAEQITNIGAIIGTPIVGSVLTAGAVTPAGANVDYQWMRYDTSSATTGVNIGLNQNTYTIVEADIGKFIKVAATGTGGCYINSKTSTALGPVPTPITVLPTIGGTATVGQTLTATVTPSSATVSYQWKRCDTSGDGDTGLSITGAIAQKYTLLAADTAKYIKVGTTGTSNFSGTTLSTATSAVSPIPVTNIAAITGTALTGSVLTAGAVTPVGATVNYQWMRCAAATDATGDSIGENKNTYTAVADDTAKFIKVIATGTGGYGGSKTSTATLAVAQAPLTAIAAITGTVSVGSPLKAGALTPATASATATYQWESFSGATGPWTTIGDSDTYTIKNGDIGMLIRVKAKATGYTGEKTSLATKAVPTPITVPTIGGIATVGQILTATARPSEATVTYQWKRCDTSGDGDTGVNINGAIAQKYTLVAIDAAKYIKVETTGFDKFSGTMLSAATTAVSPISVTDIAAITGTVKVGSVLTAGAVTPSAATVKYQWTSCTTVDGTYTEISGATAKTYTVGASEITKFIKVVATGTVGYGGSATSAATTAVPKVTVTEISAIIGTAKVGSVLTAGTVTPAGATVTYDWQTAPAASGDWTSTGIKANTYTVAEGVKYIRVVATGTDNYTSSATSTSITTNLISITNIGDIIGTLTVGSVLTVGAVSPAGATVNYDWQTATCTDLSPFKSTGITTNTYKVTEGDTGKYIQVVATGTGSYTGTKVSQTKLVLIPITAIGEITKQLSPTIDEVGSVITAGKLTPYSFGTQQANYQWLCCDTVDGTYVNIPGAVGNKYSLGAGVSGKYIKVTATGTGIYSGTVTSSAIGPVKYYTTITAIGAISGTAKVDSVLTAGAVTPAGATVTYDWQTAITVAGTWTSTGITTNTYTVAAGDKTKYIKVVATGKDRFNTTSTATSTEVGPVPTPIDSIGDITGSDFKVGVQLTAGAVAPVTATVNYQWSSCGTVDGTYVNIPGATLKIYTLKASDVTKYLKVTATGNGIYSGSVKSNPTATAITASITAIGAITGTAKVGYTLTVGALTPTGAFTPAVATATYQWTICSTASGTYSNIDGATEKTYIPVASDATKFLKVVATGDTNYPGTITSLATTAIAAAVPDAPTIGTATLGNARVEVSFTPPSSDGGSAITLYTVTSSPGTKTATGKASPITVVGLTNGTAYTFTVKATNVVGIGPASAASNPVIPAAAPAVSTNPLNRSVMVGDPASFYVTASGTPTPTYLWQVSTDGAVTWNDLANDATHSGVTTTTMTIVNTTLDMSRYQYRCKMENIGGSAFSDAGILRVESYDTDLAGTDDFSTDENWSAPTLSSSKAGLLSFTGSSLEYTDTSSSGNRNFAIREWTANVGSYIKDWTVQIDVHLEVLSGGLVTLNFAVFNSTTVLNLVDFAALSPIYNMDSMIVSIENYDIFENNATKTPNGLKGFIHSSYSYSDYSTDIIKDPATDASLKISFNSATKELTSYYSTDSGTAWKQLQKYTIGSGGYCDWGMNDSSTFTVMLIGVSQNITLNSEDAYFYNFKASSP